MYNGILLLHKEPGFTSHDAVAKLRGVLRFRRIGHAGTLDPMAQGLLVILLGPAARASEYASGADKEYVAEFVLGVETDTQDTTGIVLAEKPVQIDRKALERLRLLPADTTRRLPCIPPSKKTACASTTWLARARRWSGKAGLSACPSWSCWSTALPRGGCGFAAPREDTSAPCAMISDKSWVAAPP